MGVRKRFPGPNIGRKGGRKRNIPCGPRFLNSFLLSLYYCTMCVGVTLERDGEGTRGSHQREFWTWSIAIISKHEGKKAHPR